MAAMAPGNRGRLALSRWPGEDIYIGGRYRVRYVRVAKLDGRSVVDLDIYHGLLPGAPLAHKLTFAVDTSFEWYDGGYNLEIRVVRIEERGKIRVAIRAPLEWEISRSDFGIASHLKRQVARAASGQ